MEPPGAVIPVYQYSYARVLPGDQRQLIRLDVIGDIDEIGLLGPPGQFPDGMRRTVRDRAATLIVNDPGQPSRSVRTLAWTERADLHFYIATRGDVSEEALFSFAEGLHVAP